VVAVGLTEHPLVTLELTVLRDVVAVFVEQETCAIVAVRSEQLDDDDHFDSLIDFVGSLDGRDAEPDFRYYRLPLCPPSGKQKSLQNPRDPATILPPGMMPNMPQRPPHPREPQPPSQSKRPQIQWPSISE
jgi:hypothetical protein